VTLCNRLSTDGRLPEHYSYLVPGIFVLDGMGFQIPSGALVLSLATDGTPQMKVQAVRVRIDLWPTWLEIGCRHAEQARTAGQQLNMERYSKPQVIEKKNSPRAAS
jgi:hypothetical protein